MTERNDATTDEATEAPQTDEAAPEAPEQATPEQDSTPTLEELQERLASLEPLRKEVGNYRKRAQAAEEERDSAFSELEQLRISVVESRLIAAATGKLANPALAQKLVDTDKLGPQSSQEDFDAAVAAVLEAEPYLAAGAATPPSGDTGPQGSPADGAADANNWLRGRIQS